MYMYIYTQVYVYIHILRCMRLVCGIIKGRIQIHNQRVSYLLLFHGNCGCVNASRCYFIHTLSDLFILLTVICSLATHTHTQRIVAFT